MASSHDAMHRQTETARPRKRSTSAGDIQSESLMDVCSQKTKRRRESVDDEGKRSSVGGEGPNKERQAPMHSAQSHDQQVQRERTSRRITRRNNESFGLYPCFSFDESNSLSSAGSPSVQDEKVDSGVWRAPEYEEENDGDDHEPFPYYY